MLSAIAEGTFIVFLISIGLTLTGLLAVDPLITGGCALVSGLIRLFLVLRNA